VQEKMKNTHSHNQWPIKRYRRISQITVLIVMFLIPVLNLLELYFIKGTFYSMDIGDLAMSDPLAIFQVIITSRQFNISLIASAIIPLIAMILIGRVWCSWMCPYFTIVEFLEYVRKKLKLKPRKPVYNRNTPHKSNRIRFLFLIAGLILTGIAGIPLLNLISAPGVISSQALIWVKFQTITIEAFFILVLLILEFFFYKFWCRYFCPTGTFLSLFKTKRGLHIGKVVESCSSCMSCRNVCPMQLYPFEEGRNVLCFNCGDCIDICPDNRKKDTIKFKTGH
jgi:ferredoxin-type protein NapH